jgi:8-oxo-dGTP pyrophosphatase MutT (NUDIX family)
MEKFSQKNFEDVNKNVKQKKSKLLYSSDYMNLIEYEDWTIVDENDMVVCIPFFTERNEIILRSEYIPTFKYVEGKEMYLTCVSGTIEKGETPTETLIRELQEECGIVLVPDIKINFLPPLFLNKGNTAKIYPCVLFISELQYYTIKPSGDGSVSEKKSSSIRLSIDKLPYLYSEDVITSYMLTLLR